MGWNDFNGNLICKNSGKKKLPHECADTGLKWGFTVNKVGMDGIKLAVKNI